MEDPKKLAVESDRWGFGTTLWEIFNGGHVPICRMEPHAVSFPGSPEWLGSRGRCPCHARLHPPILAQGCSPSGFLS